MLEQLKYMWHTRGVLIQLILVNVLVFAGIAVTKVFLYLSGFGDWYAQAIRFLMLPSALDSLLWQPWSLFTYFFLHEGFFHILFNMLFLYWFGRLVEEFLGGQRVLSLYVMGGLVAGLFYVLMYNLLPYYSEQVSHSFLLGASGGVLAVVVGAATFMPDYTFNLFIFGPVRIKYIAAVYVFLSFYQIIGSNAGGNLAHLGGAFLGFLYMRKLKGGVDIGEPVISFLAWLKSFFSDDAPPSRRTRKPRTQKPSMSEQERIDAILDKVSASGYDSLSEEEKEELFRASKK